MNNTKKIILSALVTLASNTQAADVYDVVDLGDLGAKPSFAFGLNNNNNVVGYSTGETVTYTNSDGLTIAYQDTLAFAYADTVMTALGAINNGENTTSFSAAFDINDNGIAVGYSIATTAAIEATDDQEAVPASSTDKAVYFDTTSPGSFNLIPDFVADDPRQMRALSLNNNGVIVGFGKFNPPNDEDSTGNSLETYYDHGFIFDSVSGELFRVPPLTDDTALTASVRAINDAGIATGWAQKVINDKLVTSSFYFDISAADDGEILASELVEIPSFITDDEANSEGFSVAWAINDAGKIVGKTADADNQHVTAFVYDKETDELTDLGALYQAQHFSEALDINLQDQIVGHSTVSVYPTVNHAFLYENGEMKDLNNMIDCKIDPGAEPVGSPDWVLISARAINDSGIIVGNGILNGESRAFMLRPSDEEGRQPVACEPLVVEEDSGSGSFHWLLLPLLLLAGALRKRP